ncbi:MAG: hypothetical protein MSS60_05845 [Clostridiales bacterium]|nr:hypothetical protein [Clostridiales bacterium]
MQGMVPLSGFGGVPYSAVRKAAPRNLLDNSDFTNLVAQADIGGNHGTIPYAADRWILDSGTVSYEAGVGLTLNGTIRQKLEFPPTGETSAFVGMASGEASISFADGEVTITSSGGVLKWAALYSGVYTAATIPEYHPKGYGAELAECRRYYYTIKSDGSGYAAYAAGTMNAASSAYFPVLFPIPMRAIPTLSYSGSFRVYVNGGGRSITDMGSNAASRYSARIVIQNISSAVLGQACELQSNNDGTAFIAFSADL